MNMLRILCTLVAAAMLALGLTSPQSTKPVLAASVSCYGDWCSGQDPVATGCSRDGRTVASTPLEIWEAVPGTETGSWIRKGIVELRWSPACKTNWARLSTTKSTDIGSLTIVQDSGYRQRKGTLGWDGTLTSPGVFYTNMIYSPTLRCYAYVYGGNFRSNATSWV